MVHMCTHVYIDYCRLMRQPNGISYMNIKLTLSSVSIPNCEIRVYLYETVDPKATYIVDLLNYVLNLLSMSIWVFCLCLWVYEIAISNTYTVIIMNYLYVNTHVEQAFLATTNMYYNVNHHLYSSIYCVHVQNAIIKDLSLLTRLC